jgi:hypothetical protein
VQLRILGACALALLVAACGGETVTTEQQEMGTARLPLTSPSPNGKLYRLVGATFEFAGPQTVTVTDTSADTVMVPLPVGTYTAKLGGAWRLEDVAAPGTTVLAQLVSPNPLPLFVTKDQVSEVRFQFKLAGDGTADVGIRVDKGGWLSGTIQFTELQSPTPGPFDELVGKSVPFLLSYESGTLLRESNYGKSVIVMADLTTVQFGGAPSEVLARAAASMKGSTVSFSLRANQEGRLEFGGLYPRNSPNPDAFKLDMMGGPAFVGPVDSEGYPALRPFETESPYVYFRDAQGANAVRGTATISGSF